MPATQCIMLSSRIYISPLTLDQEYLSVVEFLLLNILHFVFNMQRGADVTEELVGSKYRHWKRKHVLCHAIVVPALS